MKIGATHILNLKSLRNILHFIFLKKNKTLYVHTVTNSVKYEIPYKPTKKYICIYICIASYVKRRLTSPIRIRARSLIG